MQSDFVVDYTRKYAHCMRTIPTYEKDLAGITKRLVAGMLVAVAVAGVSALTIHTPSQNSAGSLVEQHSNR